jgi:gallate dioxygenase
VAGEVKRHRQHVGEQLAGVEALPGTYPFTLERSVRALRLNRFLHGMTRPGHRMRFLADPEGAFDAAGLTAEERRLVRARDWRGLMHYGVIFFMLEKLGAVLGVSNLHIYAAMRGQSLEDFQQTRNAPGALYSVAGKDAAHQAWDQECAESEAPEAILKP